MLPDYVPVFLSGPAQSEKSVRNTQGEKQAPVPEIENRVPDIMTRRPLRSRAQKKGARARDRGSRSRRRSRAGGEAGRQSKRNERTQTTSSADRNVLPPCWLGWLHPQQQPDHGQHREQSAPPAGWKSLWLSLDQSSVLLSGLLRRREAGGWAFLCFVETCSCCSCFPLFVGRRAKLCFLDLLLPRGPKAPPSPPSTAGTNRRGLETNQPTLLHPLQCRPAVTAFDRRRLMVPVVGATHTLCLPAPPGPPSCPGGGADAVNSSRARLPQIAAPISFYLSVRFLPNHPSPTLCTNHA